MKSRKCIQEVKDNKQLVVASMSNGGGGETFSFDFVGGEESAQEDIFAIVGKPIVDQCLQGYNGSIFAYGQTGSGKTHTIQGKFEDKGERGLLPRCFEYLFQQVFKIKQTHQD